MAKGRNKPARGFNRELGKLPAMSRMPGQIERRIRDAARELGFSHVGICQAVEPPHYHAFVEWLKAGFHGEMLYLERRQGAYANPKYVLEGVRSIVMLGFPYRTVEPAPPKPGFGLVSRYAWGSDYHRVIRQRLKQLAEVVRQACPQAVVRGVVDTAPLLEREFAQLAGLGWIGKNTLLINRQAGSWLFLAALLTSVELEPDAPFAANHCGTCRACLDACPTGALIAPYVLDARRCISYLTIELRGPIPPDLRPMIGNWFFGCDICQEVCPWNRRGASSGPPELGPRFGTQLELTSLFSWSEEQFRHFFAGTPLWRAKRRGLLRNAAIVLGNQRFEKGVPGLVAGLRDTDPVVREACAWALWQIGSPESRTYLAAHQALETDPWVRERLQEYLRSLELGEPSVLTSEVTMHTQGGHIDARS